MHKRISTVIAFFVVMIFSSGCIVKQATPVMDPPSIVSDDLRTQVITLARQVGIQPNTIGRCSTKELLVDIEAKINNDNQYDGDFLTTEELKTLEIYLNHKHQILKTIKDYHNYIKRIQNQKIIILPGECP